MSQSAGPGLSTDVSLFGTPIVKFQTANTFLNGLQVVGVCILLAIAQVLVVIFLDSIYPVAAIATVLIGIGGAGMTVYGLFKGRHSVQVYPDGIAETYRGKTKAMRWDDIEWVKERITVGTSREDHGKRSYSYTLAAKNGAQLTLAVYPGADGLGDAIFKEVIKRLLPRYTEAYNRGETIRFGDIAISKAGIDFGKGPIAWGEIEELTLAMGKIAVRRSGQRLDVANHTTSETPNFSILMRMMKQSMEEAGR